MASKNKASGAEILAFYEAWPMGSDWYYEAGDADDEEFTIECEDGTCSLIPSHQYDLRKFGPIVWQGKYGHHEPVSFASAFRKWRDEQDYVHLVMRIPREQEEQARALLTGLGWLT